MYLEDQFMIFNTMLGQLIQSVEVLDLLRWHYSHLQYTSRLGEHTLWTQIFKSLARYANERDSFPSDE